MLKATPLSVTYFSDINRDLYVAEFWCGETMWGELVHNEDAKTYDDAYSLTVYGGQPGQPCIVNVAELEKLIQEAKWRLAPLSRTN